MMISATATVHVEDARSTPARTAQLAALLGAALGHGLTRALYAAADPDPDAEDQHDEHGDAV